MFLMIPLFIYIRIWRDKSHEFKTKALISILVCYLLVKYIPNAIADRYEQEHPVITVPRLPPVTRRDLSSLKKSIIDEINGGISFAYARPLIEGNELKLMVTIDGTTPLNITFGQASINNEKTVLLAYPDGRPGILYPKQEILFSGRSIDLNILYSFTRTEKTKITVGFRASNSSTEYVNVYRTREGKWSCDWKMEKYKLHGKCP